MCSKLLLLLSIVPLCYSSAQIIHRNYHLNHDSLGVQQCPPWSFYDKNSRKCQCFDNRFKCSNDGTYLKAGHCATYDNNTGIVSYAQCPYFIQSNGLNITKFEQQLSNWYILLPENMSELNDYLCGAMNRRGRVCSQCKDGFGPAVTSVGFQIQCSKCIGAWYGIPLYLFLELFPITIFYFILLIFQINITSAPMTSYIMYSQLIIFATDQLFSGDKTCLAGIVLLLSRSFQLFAKIILSIYDIWNLRFFGYLAPPFCISSRLKPIHIAFLGYISVFYPLCLILLTWGCVELHGHNFRPIVWLWKPFHRCLVHLRRGWDTKSDIIDVFASFFLLSFSKSLYQVILLMTVQKIRYKDLHGAQFGITDAINLDLSMMYGSTEHLIFAIPAITVSCIFIILPTMLLLFYPFRPFQACLSKCKLNGLALYTFVEKFYGCYRNGLDGGKDMRSFAGLYFVLRVILFFTKPMGDLLMISNFDPFYMRNIVFTVALILISLCRPYKEMYVNVLDVLLLAHLGLLCHLFSVYQAFQIQINFVYTVSAMLLVPFAGFVLLIMARFIQQVIKAHTFKAFVNKFKRLPAIFRTIEPARALVEPTMAEISYGTIH